MQTNYQPNYKAEAPKGLEDWFMPKNNKQVSKQVGSFEIETIDLYTFYSQILTSILSFY